VKWDEFRVEAVVDRRERFARLVTAWFVQVSGLAGRNTIGTTPGRRRCRTAARQPDRLPNAWREEGAMTRRTTIIPALVLLSLLATAPGVAGATGPDPVLLVHGYRGNPSTWADMEAYLTAHGHPTVYAIDLPGEDNVANARAIASTLRKLGWKRVDLVGQSMGGLSARWFAKFLAKATTIDAYVSLGTPQYGIWSACLLPSTYGGQMCPTSRFLADLNAGDDTPGATFWTTIYSTGDEFVPNSASRLDGGACFVQVSGVGHNDMDNDATVQAATVAAIDGQCPGTFQS
jgi:triacylglycerol lipase